MGVIEKMRRQTAVYWAKLSEDSSGLPVFDDPVEIPVRWEADSEVQGLSEVMRHKVNVYVDRDMRTGDYLMLVELDSSTPDDPRTVASYEVTHFETLPDFKAKKFLRTAHAVPSPLKLLALHGRGVEAVSYVRVTASAVSKGGILSETLSTSSVPAAARSPLDASELMAGGGRFRSTDISWDVPRKDVPDEPGQKGDRILDARGDRWDVIGYAENRLLRGWWRVMARRGKA